VIGVRPIGCTKSFPDSDPGASLRPPSVPPGPMALTKKPGVAFSFDVKPIQAWPLAESTPTSGW
jgi:hypothetical protein